MKKKGIILAATGVIVILVVAILLLLPKEEKGAGKVKDSAELAQIKSDFQKGIQGLKDGKYANLIYKDFEASIEDVEGVYRLEIKANTEYKDRTFLENVRVMKNIVEKFFNEDFDKSFISVDIKLPDEDDEIKVPYDEVEEKCSGTIYDSYEQLWFFGNEVRTGGYMVQMIHNLNGAWLSRGKLGDIGSFEHMNKKFCPYLSGKRQGDDIEVNLKDGKITLSEMEKRVNEYMKNHFPLEIADGISYGIGRAMILDNGEYEGLSFTMTRIYKGIIFEYGNGHAGGGYRDELGHDAAILAYAESEHVDTMMSFGFTNGTVTETEEIKEILPLEDALRLLSESIGENSVYDVHGVELVYRNVQIPEEEKLEINDRLDPKWKITTINQNDDKYTLFYVDVVTGEITQRFEYYYE